MGFDRPALFLVLLGILPIVWVLHRWLNRPRTVTVSSLMFWRDLSPETGSRLKRWQPTVLLAFEVLLCCVLVGILAGPFRVSSRPEKKTLTVLLDRQPGMGALGPDGNRTRLQTAVSRLLGWLANVSGRVRIRLVTVPQAPGGPREFDGDDRGIVGYLNALTPAARGADLEAAVRLLSHIRDPILVVTDRDQPRALDASRALSWMGVGGRASNMGFIWASGESSGNGKILLSLGVLNGGGNRGERRLMVEAGGKMAMIKRVCLMPGEVWGEGRVSIPEWCRNRPFSVRLDGTDSLSADDVVHFRPVPSGEIAIVARENVPLRVLKAVESLGAEVIQVGLGDEPPEKPCVYWRVFPVEKRVAPYLLVAGEGGWEGLNFGPSFTPVSVVEGEGAVRVSSSINPYPEQVVQSLVVKGWKGWSVDLFGLDEQGRKYPLILHRQGGYVLAFDPVGEAPGWKDQAAFPVFFYQALGQERTAFDVEGLLSPPESRLGTCQARPKPLEEGEVGCQSERDGLQLWFLLAALLALGSVILLEQGRA